jgi:hypothetical protein
LATDQPNEFYIVDRHMILNRYMSVSQDAAKDGNMINCTSFAGGIIEGMMKTAGFSTTKVDAVYTHAESDQVINDPANITFIVKIEGIRK